MTNIEARVNTQNKLMGPLFQYFLASNYTSFGPQFFELQIYYPKNHATVELHGFDSNQKWFIPALLNSY